MASKYAPFIVALTFLVGVVVAIPFEHCDSPLWKPKYVEVSTWPPKAGKQVTLIVKGRTHLKITGGRFKYKVEYRVHVKLFRKTYYTPIDEGEEDICDYLSCPTKSRWLRVEYKFMLPKVLLPGDYRVTVTAWDFKGNELMCIRFHVNPTAVTSDAAVEKLMTAQLQDIQF